MRRNILFLSCIFIIVLIIFLFFMFWKTSDPLDVNVSDISLNIEIERFDKQLSEVFDGDAFSNIQNLNSKYPVFYDSFNENVIGVLGGIDNSAYEIYLSTFLDDYSVVEASMAVDRNFEDLTNLTNELNEGFKHLLYYFPDFNIPRIVSFVAGFNQSIIILDDYIGIGLDKYLGVDSYIYDMLGIPEFSRLEMTPEQIPIDLMMALFESEYLFAPKSNNLLENIIYNGIKLYFLRAMFPSFDISRINKYTKDDIKFCLDNERHMWTDLIENKLLFETDRFLIRKFVDSAPFTGQFGTDSPPRAANWLGMRIVESYMKTNDLSLQNLFEISDYQQVLTMSGYNPK